jgi:hypothetical protein
MTAADDDPALDSAPAWLGRFLRRLLRVSVSRDAVLQFSEVVKLIPGREADVRNWVRTRVPPLHGPCGDLYLWGDVVEAMRGRPLDPADASRSQIRRLPRSSLDTGHSR